MAVSLLFPAKLLDKFVQQKNRKETEYVHTFFGAASRYEKNIFPREWFTESVSLKFGEKEYPVSKHYDALLTKLYGDYMTPPGDDIRKIKTHVALVDVNNSYEIYLEEQKNFKFDTYTRSIR